MTCDIIAGICQTHQDPQECPFHNPGGQVAGRVLCTSDCQSEKDSLRAEIARRVVQAAAETVEAVEDNSPCVKVPTLQVMGPLRHKGYTTDAGFDLPASEETWLSDTEIRPIPTGIRVKIPAGYFGRIVPRSSAARRGLEVIDGTIDAGYTGELFIMAKATCSLIDIQVKPGEAIAQLILLPVPVFEVVGVEAFDVVEGERGERGFGSTGL